VGAVAPDVSLSYMLGNEGDPDGQFCSVRGALLHYVRSVPCV
jgi:hypothetical protein